MTRRRGGGPLSMAAREGANILSLYAAHQAIQKAKAGSGREGQKRKRSAPKKNTFKRKVASRKGVFPSYRIGPKLARFGRKGKKPAPLKGTARTIEKTFVSEQPVTNYVGFRQFGTGKDILKSYAMNLMKDIFKRAGAPIDSWQGAPKGSYYIDENNNRLKKIMFIFQQDDFDSATRNIDSMNIPQAHPAGEPFSVEEYADQLVTILITKWDAGYLPSAYQLVEQQQSGIEQSFYSHETWGEDIVHFDASTYVNVQNVTPADGPGDGTNINDINANPLVGKIYDFKHAYCKFREEYARECARIPGYTSMHTMQNTDVNSDLLSTYYLRYGSSGTGELLTAFKKPPRGAAVFDNVDGVKTVSLPPGGYQYMKRSVSVKANTRRFIAACFADVQPSHNATMNVHPPIINKVMIMAFEPAVRSVTDESTKVIFNRKIHHRIVTKKKRPSNLPRHNEVHDVDSTFY